jgi:glycosyltransferase involved in cell wall biosynthesis
MSDLIQKLEQSIENLKGKSAKIYFFVQDTKGNARASVRYIYEMAMTLKKLGYNPHILHEKSDYFGVQDWLGEEYMELPHTSVEGQNLQIAPEDTIVIPELFGYVMSQVANLPCAKIVICQSYDYIFETLQPGQTWSQFGFNKCITTSESMKDYISKTMRGCSIDVLEPTLFEGFNQSKFPSKPIIAIHTREQRDAVNFIKSFYAKFPQYRWISFRDMRGLSQKEFADILKDCMVSVWIDDVSSFGTYPLESMACRVPVIGKAPSLVPNWISENNGIWIQEKTRLQDILADFIQNWLEDNVSDNLYNGGIETANNYKDSEKFKNTVSSLFEGYFNIRKENFESELNKHQVEQNS